MVTLEDRMFGRYGDMTPQQESDCIFFMETISASVAESVLRTFCEACGGEFLKHPFHRMTFDVIGVRDFLCTMLIREMRPAGIVFRYFDTHAGRLTEFQSRLDAAKRRRNVTR